MNELSFDIKTSEDFLKKLLEDHEEFNNNILSSRIALNCAMTAWHLSEWIYNEFNSQIISDFNSLTLFQNNLKVQCPSLQIMHDLANGTKHYLLTRHNSSVEETEIHRGQFSRQFSHQFNVSVLKIKLKDGSILFFENEIKIVIAFWKQYFEQKFNIIV